MRDNGVRADADNVDVFVTWEFITELLGFDRSTGCVVFRIEEDYGFLTSQVRKCNRATVLVLK